ncbi:hypothetical protein [Parasphingorhabdus sp.]|uniref:hypothetical protein n=1 Tax=Parasphingorhabdus sp. TaxID=2709688 RepID=UPI0032991C53
MGYSTSLIPVQRRRRENSQAGTKPFLNARRCRRTQAGQWRASGRGARRITETARGPESAHRRDCMMVQGHARHAQDQR